ncbi:STY4851/ECs_5259 family protein [Alteromonas sp. ASW11-36]|uniref:STY4851/ECs_5259 family protein n=1 Tax=Alteromonas arenosi TaxID=3055817 RepID=A0ABT7T0F8_9ALTE|nr:STY4851/ECs_5259 family protein [Alteromonas sp. ASW11-36]MDM7861921.1 STY4851/ECs_5259 family protein [Alteromonas sp. ASW11-36]
MYNIDGVLGEGKTVSGFIISLLHQRELTEPNGSPLFTYQLSADAYSRLRSLLQASPPNSASLKNAHWCAAFCLFGAEWYRREYQSAWSWSGIFHALGFELEPGQRADAVIKGLAYWKRPVNRYESNRNDYLGSLFSEGGLPFSLLAAEGGRFLALFRKLLVEFDRARSFGVSPVPLIEQQLQGMPDAFHSDSTVTLLHDMVSNLYALIDTYSLEEQSAPAEHLDSVVKNWRVSFPIPLDTETGDKFLSGLLYSAAARRKDKKRELQRLKLCQWLSNSSELSFAASIHISKQFTIPLTRKDLSAPIVEVLVFEGKTQIADFGMARAEISDNGITLQMRKTEVFVRRDHHEVPLSIVVMQSGRVSYIEEIPASTLSLNDMPVLLAKQNDKYEVVGCGSVSQKAESLVVLFPEDAHVDSTDATLIDDVQFQSHRRVGFSGELVICYSSAEDNDTYHLSNKEDSYSKESLEIKGEQVEFPSQGGYPVYKGVPRTTCHYPEARVFIGDNEVGSAAHSAELYGRQVLRVKAQGKTLYRRKIAILPNDFEIELQPGQNPNTGKMSITSEKAFIYNVDSELDTKTLSENGTKHIVLSSRGIPPVHIGLQVQANLLAEPISLVIPFPCRGALVFDANGKVLPRHCAIKDLLGVRAVLFKAPNKPRTEFDIELKAPTSSKDNPSYVFHYDVQKSAEEVSLFELRDKIKELLATAQNNELDEVVRMVINSQGTVLKQYTVGWNAASGKVAFDTLMFSSDEVRDFSELKLELINLADPNEKPEVLTQRLSNGVPTGVFELPQRRVTPKLAVPQKASAVSFRAIFVPPTESAVLSGEVRSLEKAAQHYHPVHNTDAFTSVLDAMATNLEHSGWRYLDKLLESYGHLPLATFEAWKALAKHKGCLALLPFATKQAVETVLELLQTQCNVVWELIPLRYWREAIERYRVYLENLGFPEPLVAKYSQDKTVAITGFMSLPELFSVDSKNKAMYPILINTWKDDLLRHSADVKVRWPQHYGTELQRAVLTNFRELASFDVPHEFQSAVMYFPIMAAAVVMGKADWKEHLGSNHVNYFLLRQLLEFDRDWFNPVFQCALSFFEE